MSVLDYRRIESVCCAGLPISTFLSDCKNYIMVSASDLVDQLSLDVDLDELLDFGAQVYLAYDIGGRQQEHICIPHLEVNNFLFMHVCKESEEANLEEFRKFFLYEVITFWERFGPSAANLTTRDAVKVIDRKVTEYQDVLGVPPGRLYEMAVVSMGYEYIPRKDELTTEELAFVAYSELLYASVVASEQAIGVSSQESMQIAENRLEGPLKAIGYITRGVSGV